MTRIRILATSDVHGYIYPNSYATKEEQNIGFAKIKKIVDTFKNDNTLILDNGDILEGSPLAYYHLHNKVDEVSPMTMAMNEIGYDYVNVGNHDFNYGEEVLMMHLQNLKAPCITNNWIYHDRPFGPTYVLRTFGTTKVALFGLVTPYITQWEKKAHIANSRFADVIETAKKTVETIKRIDKPDFIICMYHGGFERDMATGIPTEDLTGENQAYQLIQEVSGIDLLISGHQHRSISGKINHTTYTQTTCNGAEVAMIDIDSKTRDIKPYILKCDMEADEDLMKRFQKEEDECQTWLDQPLGTTNLDLTITDENEARQNKSQVVTFLNLVEKEATGADLTSNALFLHATGFRREITMRDLVSTYVFPNTLVVKKVTGKVLREYLEKTAEFFTVKGGQIGVNPAYDYPKPQHYNYDMVDGITYTIKVSNDPGSRITELLYEGRPVQDDDTFTLAVNNYRAAGGGNYHMIKNSPTVKEINQSMVELLAQYISEHKVVDFEPMHNITVTL